MCTIIQRVPRLYILIHGVVHIGVKPHTEVNNLASRPIFHLLAHCSFLCTSCISTTTCSIIMRVNPLCVPTMYIVVHIVVEPQCGQPCAQTMCIRTKGGLTRHLFEHIVVQRCSATMNKLIVPKMCK